MSRLVYVTGCGASRGARIMHLAQLVVDDLQRRERLERQGIREGDVHHKALTYERTLQLE